jgi:hypothetical protein
VSFVLNTRWIWIGLAIMIVSEAATIAKIEPFWSWNTPIAWTGFLIFADAIVWRTRRNSWIRSNAREFILLALVSIPLWVLFEGYNQILRNWHYVGLPENPALRYFGYAWSFATIWPALFLGAELMSILRSVRLQADRHGPAKAGHYVREANPPALPVLPALVSIAVGALMLASPLFVSRAVAQYMAAPVWLGFIFLLDPVNAHLGAESLWRDWRAGRRSRLINLALSGFLCGVLWELWNYWARAKWIYTVPIMEHLKIFEMPVPGYFGFPAFALECFTMYVFIRRLFTRGGRAIAL